MAKKKDYIPNGNSDFFDWQQNLATRVVANAVAWQVPTGKVTALTTAQGIYEPLYNAIKIAAGRTPQQVDAHTEGRKVYEKFMRDFVKENLLFNTAITHDEKVGMGLNPASDVHGSRPAIATSPDIKVKSMGDLRIKFEFRAEGDSNRPSIQPDADGVELKYLISATPVTVHALKETHLSTKARFTHRFDEDENEGLTLYFAARWKNIKDNSKSGPWSTLMSVKIT